MQNLLGNVRFYVLVFSVLLSLGIFLFITLTVENAAQQTILLTQTFAFTAVIYLYVALLTTPLTRLFLKLPFRGLYVKARRSIGVSAWYFATLHYLLGLYGVIGGPAAVFSLPVRYKIALLFSYTALIILTFMAATSFDKIVAKMTYRRWKFLHRFVYLAGISIVIHATLFGSHFAKLSGVIPKIFYAALAVLLILESIRIDKYLKTKFKALPRLREVLIGIVVGVYLLFLYNTR